MEIEGDEYMVHAMVISSEGTRKKIVIDGHDISGKVSSVFVCIDPEGLPKVHLICTPMNLLVYADDVKIVEHITKMEKDGEPG